MNCSEFIDIQSWWQVPSIAYYCSLFRTAFSLLDFDIEDLEEALLNDGTDGPSCFLLTELMVRLLIGCFEYNGISAFNYQMYLRRLFRRRCHQTIAYYNPFDADIDFQFLPLRTKVEILYTLCDFRLDANDVYDLFKNLEAESLRVEPLGWDNNESAYWYFYGTRLYREDYIIKEKEGPKHKRNKKEEKRRRECRTRDWFYGDDWLDEEKIERVWQVVCFTEEDWIHLTEKFKNATTKVEKELYRSLSQNFLPEIPRLFEQKQKLKRKRLLQAKRRTSSRVLRKYRQKEEGESKNSYDSKDEDSKETPTEARNNRAKRRARLRRSERTSASADSSSDREEMPQKVTRPSRAREKKSKNSSSSDNGEPPPEPVVKTGRKTNNSLAAATGQIVIPDNDETVNANSTRRKLKTSQIFSQTEEDIQTDMYKVLEQLTAHENAWPFMDPVEEDYAPNYYAVIRRPMDLSKMEERLDSGYYTDFSMFKADFKLIVNNCRLYNGQENEYSIMVDSLENAFEKLTEKYIHNASSSDEEIAVEYQLPTPSRKHKIKPTESPIRKKRKRCKSPSVESMTSPSTSKLPQEKEKEKEKKKEKKKEKDKHREILEEVVEEPKEEEQEEIKPKDVEKNKESHKKHDKGKKKRHHRHGKHSKNHKKNSHKSRESRKHKKHGKNKDKKSKKKKNKHHDVEPPKEIKRALSQESLESSYRSRSASPLPSIHTPSPSPTELDQSNDQKSYDQSIDSDFLKDKYDKIKERKRHTAKDAWESLFDYKQKADKNKHVSGPTEKDKNHKLRETIEKLKAKNKKYKESILFNNFYAPEQSGNEDDDDLSDDSIERVIIKPKRRKKSSAKNASASVALEQAVKDINKWLNDDPKAKVLMCTSPSPTCTYSTEDQENSRHDDESSQGEKPILSRKDLSRKRPSSREPKVVKRREIQRTIDRLQPGKSKGNLITNMSNKNADKTEEVAQLGPSRKRTRESKKTDESSPKLSLGSVLPTVQFTLGSDHNFNNTVIGSDKQKEKKKVIERKDTQNDTLVENKPAEKTVHPTKKDAEVETDPQTIIKPSQEKATPNLSAWFKAFGAPKTTTTNPNHSKKKVNATDKEKITVNTNTETKRSPKNVTTKFDSLNDLNSPNADGGDSPLPSIIVTTRQRRTSTGSSISERSSFSQDLDSPRHQMSHNSPLLRSPASPRTDDFQKMTYPIINGTVRAGFYQDTTSLKSSPEKSCSPRDAPQSPYSQYSQHVYASNNGTGSSTPNYFVDHNKSPLPTYGQNAPPYYDTSKAPVVSKPARVHDDYTALGPDSFQQNNYNGSFSPTPSPFPATQSNYSQPQISPQPELPTSQPPNAVPMADPKTSLFPVKKRTYNDPENLLPLKKPDNNEIISSPPKNEYHVRPLPQSPYPVQVQVTNSVDDIALALSEKSEMLKKNTLRDKMGTIDYSERRNIENKDNVSRENDVVADEKESEIHHVDLTISSVTKEENINMINMGYLNNENRKVSNESPDVEFVSQTQSRVHLNPQPKGYEIEAIALNLGINNHQFSKPQTNMTPAHSHPLDRPYTDVSISQNIPIAHHNHYDALPTGQSMSNFSLNDIELANKKLYGCNTPVASPALDYGSWKMNSMRKSEVMPSDYSATSYTSSNDNKLRPIDSPIPIAINYNKNVQKQQYDNYSSVSRGAIPRSQELQQNLTTEIRVPNLRGIHKCDPISTTGTINECDNVAKNIETITTSQKAEKHSQNHPLVSSLPYKTSYGSHSALPIDTLRSLPQMLERYSNDDRYLSSFANPTSTLYHDKTFQMFNKNIPSETHPVSTSVSSLYAQSPVAAMTKENNTYKAASSIASNQIDPKKNKRKKTSDTKQLYTTTHTATCGSDVMTSVNTTMMPTTPFNFGTASNMSLSGMYGENGGFTIEDIRNSTNQLMAANYMAAAVAHQQRSNETNTEKLVKPAHQNSNHSASSFPFIGHSQVRAGYPFVGVEQSAPLYQQYWQRYQEELQRQTGAQIMGLYPSAYSTPLGVRQPYDSINRPSWP